MATQRHQIARIGVTGGIGSGKTAVCRMFEERGIPVLYADSIAREISDTDAGVKRRIATLFGVEAYDSAGKLNRRYIASVAFGNTRVQTQLNAIIHPKVEKELDRRSRDVSLAIPFVVIEAALIYEAGLDKMLDAIVVVDAEESLRVKRVVERDRVTSEEVKKRIKAQWSQAEKLDRADVVIRNNGTLAELESQVDFLYTLFVKQYGIA